MALLTSHNDTATARSSDLPLLLALAAMLLFWVAGDDARERMTALEAQLTGAQNALVRAVQRDALDQPDSSTSAPLLERRALELRLSSQDDMQTARAKTIFDLRRKCAATGAQACNVRLSESASSAVGKAASAPFGRPDGKVVSLEDLGIQKVRAIVAGSFQSTELLLLTDSLNSDPAVQWQINGMVVRANGFEFDVERHLRLRSTAAAPDGKP